MHHNVMSKRVVGTLVGLGLVVVATGAASSRDTDMPASRSKAIAANGSMYALPMAVDSGRALVDMGRAVGTDAGVDVKVFRLRIDIGKTYPLAWDVLDSDCCAVGVGLFGPAGTLFVLRQIPVEELAAYEVDKGPKRVVVATTQGSRRNVTAPKIQFLIQEAKVAASKRRRPWFGIRMITRDIVDIYVLADEAGPDVGKTDIHLQIWRFDGTTWSRRHSIPSPFDMPFEIIECTEAVFLYGRDDTLWHLEGTDAPGESGPAATAPATRPAAEQATETAQQKEGEKQKPALSLRKVGTIPGGSILIIDKVAKRALAVSDTTVFTVGKEITQAPLKPIDEVPGAEKLAPWARRAFAVWRASRQEKP